MSERLVASGRAAVRAREADDRTVVVDAFGNGGLGLHSPGAPPQLIGPHVPPPV
jgi:hypothetical protein